MHGIFFFLSLASLDLREPCNKESIWSLGTRSGKGTGTSDLHLQGTEFNSNHISLEEDPELQGKM